MVDHSAPSLPMERGQVGEEVGGASPELGTVFGESATGLRPPSPGGRADAGPVSESGRSRGGGAGRKPHRRGKQGGRRHSWKEPWKPYALRVANMSYEERKKLEEREARRATKKREIRFQSGQPMAPYNTTQFLMEQHEGEAAGVGGGENNFNFSSHSTHHHHHSRDHKHEENPSGEGGSGGSDLNSSDSPSHYSSPEDDEEMEKEFLEKEFTEAYDSYRAERLFALSKDALVREYVDLEAKVETLEKKLASINNNSATLNPPSGVAPATRLLSPPGNTDSGNKAGSAPQNGLKSPGDSTQSTEKGSAATTKVDSKIGQTAGPISVSQTSATSSDATKDKSSQDLIAALQEEISRLKQENQHLSMVNTELKRTQATNAVNEGEP